MILKIQIAEKLDKGGDLLCATQTLWCEVISISSQPNRNSDITTYRLKDCPVTSEVFEGFCDSSYLVLSGKRSLLCAIWGDENEDLKVLSVQEDAFPHIPKSQ